MKANFFVGIKVEAGPWLAETLRELPAGIRRFHPEDLHLTVAFLGGCSLEQAEAAWSTLEGRSHPPIRLQISALMAMGSPRHPSAYALTFGEGKQEAAALMSSWREPAWEAASSRRDSRAALPHLTIARPPRKGREIRRLGMEWLQKTEPRPAVLLLDQVALYTWSQDRKSRLFRILKERPLQLRAAQ